MHAVIVEIPVTQRELEDVENCVKDCNIKDWLVYVLLGPPSCIKNNLGVGEHKQHKQEKEEEVDHV